jgi:lipopolysaccharide/colanic/teichoic acid biosynthesis glycosyltransferase
MRDLFNYIISVVGILLIFPIIIIISLLIFLSDFNNPFYISYRVGVNDKPFKLIKFRSMKINKIYNKIVSTSDKDERITSIGKFIRRFKIDELPQLFNILFFHMSLVGPRPNVFEETRMYTESEKKLLSVKPGITDFASIVFSDEGKILSKFKDANLAYNQLIRPWKSKLGLIYIDNKSLKLDIFIILITILSIYNRKKSLNELHNKLKLLNVDQDILDVVLRNTPLKPSPPPGRKTVISKEEIDLNYGNKI